MSSQGSQYEIIRKLGEGGMGMVYLAKDTMIQRLVAIKQLHRNTGSEEERLGERFQAEALALAKLNHPNVTHLYSFIPKEDNYWMIMEYVEGKTLEDWIFTHKKITHQLAASIAVQILDGLYHAHRKGIIHRDIKPANVMINEDGEVKIMDFGIARMRNAQRITSHGKSVGTLEYMAPEQIQGHEGDERTDVYAVGNILYEMLCGTTPFQSDTDYRLMKDKLEKRPESISRENPTVPVCLEKIIFKALHRNPNKRYQSALGLKHAIEKCIDGALLDQSTLTKVLQASQVFTEPQKENEIISVGKILSQAKSISGRFKVPTFDIILSQAKSIPERFKVPAFGEIISRTKSVPGRFKVPAIRKINRPVLILGVSVLLSAILLIFSGEPDVSDTEEALETPVIVNWDEPSDVPADGPRQDVIERTSGNFDETPSEMYRRINKQPVEQPTPNVKKNNNARTIVNDRSDSKPKPKPEPKPKPKNTSESNERSKNVDENRKVSHAPADVPAGKFIDVTLMEDLSSEKKERDGTTIKLICNENVVADDRVIIRKGAAVTGKIVDCIPSSHPRKKALIGFVIQGVEAVDGSTVKLRSERFRLYSDAPGIAVKYRSGQTFKAKLRRGRVN